MKIINSAPPLRYHLDNIHLSFIDEFFIKPKRKKPTFYRNMFNEDFARIFRSSSGRSSNIFNIKSNNDELTQKLILNIKTRYSHHSVDKKLRQLVEEIAQSLIWFGTAYYFLDDLFENENTKITPLSTIGVFCILKLYLQLVPKRRENYWDSSDNEHPRELRIIDRTRLMHFSMPKSIKKILSKQNRALAVLDKHQYDCTRFYSKATHENPNPKNDFDFRVWRDTQERLLYRATRETGWNGRKYDTPKHSDFFVCHRLIRFRRNQLILRDYILEQLGNEFTKVGRKYNADFRVTILPTNALPKVNKLNDLEARLSREEVSFTEVSDFCFEHSMNPA